VGSWIYTDPGLTTQAPCGYYYDGTYCYEACDGGAYIIAIGQCNYVYRSCNQLITDVKLGTMAYTEIVQTEPVPFLTDPEQPVFKDLDGNCWTYVGSYGPNYISPDGTQQVNISGNYFVGVPETTYFDCNSCGTIGINYTMTLQSQPCVNNVSTFQIAGAAIDDVVVVRATFAGIIKKALNNFTRADLTIGNQPTVSSTCYSDTNVHTFSITSDYTITFSPSSTATFTTNAITNNSFASATNMFVEIISINGLPPTYTISVAGCKGDNSTGGNC